MSETVDTTLEETEGAEDSAARTDREAMSNLTITKIKMKIWLK